LNLENTGLDDLLAAKEDIIAKASIEAEAKPLYQDIITLLGKKK